MLKRRLRWDLITVFKPQKGDDRVGGDGLFSVAARGRTRSSAIPVAEEIQAGDKEELSDSRGGVEHWNKLPRVVVESLSLDVSKSSLDRHRAGMLILPWAWGWMRQCGEVFST